MNIIPESAPFTREQRAWLNGFLAGVFYDRQGTPSAGAASAPASIEARPLLVGFGSQSGSAAGLARRFGKLAEARGYRVTLKELNAVKPAELPAAGRFVVITSTWGDGEPPDNATGFWAALAADGAPSLAGLPFAVLGLGDRNYSDFCGAARRMDERLAALGGTRLVGRGECDVDYEAPATAWIEALWAALEGAPVSAPTTVPVAEPKVSEAAEVGWSRKNPFPARLRVARPLNGPGSGKDTRHVEILLGDSGLSYEAGDALGVMPQNCPALVEELLATLGMTGDESVETGGVSSLHEGLLRQWVVTQPTPGFVKLVAERAPGSELAALLDPVRKSDLDAWLHGRDLVDVLRAAPGVRLTVAELIQQLRPLQPRLYSISSSPKAHPGEVHLTVGTVRYEAHGRPRKGVTSCWLADRVVPGETPVPVFVHVSRNFRPPTDPTRPMILVGPGTGIAPFRAFLEERRAIGAKGRNWLFFGDQRRSTDFLYADELEPMHRDGFLTRLDLAFSRDQAGKVYVQDRMRESGAELWRWMEEGAHFYVCGDARRMAKDVDAALREIVGTHGGRSAEAVEAYVTELKSAGRYQRDVY
jgi:sulfite reductase (NADPH) flavoprotein alpha-component